MIKPNEIKKIRNRLGMTQHQFATFLGAHSMTVSKWETGLLEPSNYQESFIRTFGNAQKKFKGIGKYMITNLYDFGIISGLYEALRITHNDK